MRQILWGLFKKIVVADNCAIIVDTVFSNYQSQDGMSLLLGAVLFSFQIYGDFSGYSDIAIGCAHLFGINLMRNFNVPYFSRDIAEFWRRWHISLTTWFRDYLYIPLGGSREGKWKSFRNTMIIFLVSGFWHGANWTFVCWGAYHALLFLPLLLLGKNRKYRNIVAEGRLFPSWKEMGQMFLTFFLAVIGWILFRAETIRKAGEYILFMFTRFHLTIPAHGKMTILFVLVLVGMEWIQRDKQFALQMNRTGIFRWTISRWSIYCLLILVLLIWGVSQAEFIYFQF